jgi:hypothetical protein
MMCPWHDDSTDRRARDMNGARGTHAGMSPADGGVLDPERTTAGMTKSHTHPGTWSRPLCVSAGAPRSTVERRCNVATPHAAGTTTAQLQLAPSSSRETLFGVTIQDT